MRIVIVSNRIPVSIVNDNGVTRYKKSEGGLASGMGAYVDHVRKSNPGTEVIWIGWPGGNAEDEKKTGREIFEKFGLHSVFLEEAVMENFYQGFCNKTIWPLFHYFPLLTGYEKKFWQDYIYVNYRFCEIILRYYRHGDLIWIHDYHLMLLPEMIREAIPEAMIGFFLHIPFPSYEIFRMLPSEWRKKILEGLYGADLIGFHTFDYRTYFLRSTLNILGLTDHMGEVIFRNRLVKVDAFPMGIDYHKYHSAANRKPVRNEIAKISANFSSEKIILSLDRQDYTKGILNRLAAYEYFLQENPQWIKRVTLILVVIPSRVGVESYQSIKSQIDEMVGRINGTYASLDWQPIHYQYRSLTHAELIALYNYSDIALITPLRDGMNLIAKEFVAARTNKKGVLILSEMAGVAHEMDDAVIINPNNMEEISQAISLSLEMPPEEQERRISSLQRRVKLYNIFKWAEDYTSSLLAVKKKQERLKANRIQPDAVSNIIRAFANSSSRILFLDYDGTLVEHDLNPARSYPDQPLLELLNQLCSINNLHVVIISGRDRSILDAWFGHLPVELVAEHGVFVKEKNGSWRLIKPVRKNWKRKIYPVLNQFVEKLPGSFIEEKEYSLAFHYRKSDPLFAKLRVKELFNQLVSLTANLDLQVFNGSKVLEIRNSGIDKGVAAMNWLDTSIHKSQFILAIGNDQTDEDLFRSLPPDAYTMIVGNQLSHAKYNVSSPAEVRNLLIKLVASAATVQLI